MNMKDKSVNLKLSIKQHAWHTCSLAAFKIKVGKMLKFKFNKEANQKVR